MNAARVAIVGSRRRTDRERILELVNSLPIDTVVISGGASGPDTWAVEAAHARGLATVVHQPALAGARTRFAITERYYARNQCVVDDCDRVIAFVAPDRKGGTEDTIRRAISAGKPVELR